MLSLVTVETAVAKRRWSFRPRQTPLANCHWAFRPLRWLLEKNQSLRSGRQHVWQEIRATAAIDNPPGKLAERSQRGATLLAENQGLLEGRQRCWQIGNPAGRWRSASRQKPAARSPHPIPGKPATRSTIQNTARAPRTRAIAGVNTVGETAHRRQRSARASTASTKAS